ncbi:hypothetical protein Y032_0073g790 [Ancylostoma ceylanicum]|uniref:Uncharacterized protein n=1 Tax=Ancylostoma ceylanicum TaxID=53326 RepID=A0A016TW07_9BILA|nr:hypothetical protein Y032_0073g790 [Ancylostoma ceylanicum]
MPVPSVFKKPNIRIYLLHERVRVEEGTQSLPLTNHSKTVDKFFFSSKECNIAYYTVRVDGGDPSMASTSKDAAQLRRTHRNRFRPPLEYYS